MDRETFLALDPSEQNWLIYNRGRTAPAGEPGASPLEGNFGPDRGPTVQPEPPMVDLDPLFLHVFGEQPPRNTGRNSKGKTREQWDIDRAAYGGQIDLKGEFSYAYKAGLSTARGLGVPLAYRYGDSGVLTFELKPSFMRDLLAWNTGSRYQTAIEVAANSSI